MHVRLFLLVVLSVFTAAQANAQTEAGTMPDPRTDEAIALMNHHGEEVLSGIAMQMIDREF